VSLLDYCKIFSHKVREGTRNDRDCTAVLSVVIGAIDIENEAAYVAE
jgi:hypothetical protein